MNKRKVLIALVVFLIIDALILLAVFRYNFFGASKPKAKRIIFVTIDTLRADHLSPYGYPREVSPFISSLAQNGAVFLTAYTAAPHTAPSHATMFTSLFPFQHKLLRNQETLDPDIFTIQKFNDAIGFQSAAFPSVKFMEGKVGFPFLDGITDGNDKNFKKFWYRNATNVVDNAIAWIKTIDSDAQFFTWLHFYDVHEWSNKKNIPSNYFERIKKLPQDEHLDFLINNHKTPVSFFGTKEKTLRAINGYDARIMYVDDELKRLSGFLIQNNLNEDILWIITSDHGEGLGNHNYKGHGQFLYQEQLHVPLIFYSKNIIKPQRIEQLSRTVDLFPTIADLVGSPLDTKAHKLEGVSLFPLISGNSAAKSNIKFSFAERRPKDMISFRRDWEEGEVYSLHDLDRKYIEHSNGIDEYYDLKLDPFEEKNIEDQNPGPMNEIKSTLSDLFDPSKRNVDTSIEETHTSEELEELKSLGYM